MKITLKTILLTMLIIVVLIFDILIFTTYKPESKFLKLIIYIAETLSVIISLAYCLHRICVEADNFLDWWESAESDVTVFTIPKFWNWRRNNKLRILDAVNVLKEQCREAYNRGDVEFAQKLANTIEMIEKDKT